MIKTAVDITIIHHGWDQEDANGQYRLKTKHLPDTSVLNRERRTKFQGLFPGPGILPSLQIPGSSGTS
jgi:hypothetical protein